MLRLEIFSSKSWSASVSTAESSLKKDRPVFCLKTEFFTSIFTAWFKTISVTFSKSSLSILSCFNYLPEFWHSLTLKLSTRICFVLEIWKG